MIPALLVALALVDAMLCGFRDAAGRCLPIEKAGYYRRAVARGLVAGLIVLAGLGAVAGLLIGTAADPAGSYSTMCSAGASMVWVYGSYATLVFLALGGYLIPDEDVSTLATVIILGPFTMLRPWVIWAGAAAAIVAAREVRTAVLAVAAATVMSGLEPALGRAWRGGDTPLGPRTARDGKRVTNRKLVTARRSDTRHSSAGRAKKGPA